LPDSGIQKPFTKKFYVKKSKADNDSDYLV